MDVQEALVRYPDLPVISITDRRRYKQCPRLWDIASPLRRSLKPRAAQPELEFGTMFHEALDHGYRLRTRDGGYGYADMPGYFGDLVDFALGGIQQSYKPWADQAQRYADQRALGLIMLREYARIAPGLDDFEIVATEHAGMVPILVPGPHPMLLPHLHGGVYVVSPGVPFALYYYRSDGVVRDGNGRLWLMEHKTCGRWWSETQLSLDEQLTANIWVEQQHYNEPIVGAVVTFFLKRESVDPPMLLSGIPTKDVRKLAYVPAERYEAALREAGAMGWGAAALASLKARDAEQGHPTIRRVKEYRTAEAVERQGQRIAREALRMLVPPAVIDPSPGVHCGWCPARVPCQQMEQGDDAEFTLKALFEPATPPWRRTDAVVEESGQ